MMPVSMYGAKEMKVVRLIIQETGTYNQIYRRPYETHLDHTTKNAIMEAVDRSRAITSTALAGVAQAFISPSANPEAAVGIANGWHEPRFRFMLEVQTTDRTGLMVTREYINGYSDHAGASHMGSLDPHMVLYVNSVNTVKESYVNTPIGSQVHHNQVDASHILVNDQYKDVMAPGQMFGLRPEDVYDQIDSRQIQTADNFVYDGRSKITTAATKSRRANAVAPIYMANVLDSYLQTNRSQIGESNTGLLESARETVKSSPMTEDAFMSWVRAMSQNGMGNHFTLGDLQRMDPNAPNVTHFEPLNQQFRASLVHAGQHADWGGSDYTTLFCSVLTQSVPSYMTRFGINKVRIMATNETLGGIPVINLLNPRTLAQGVDISPQLEAFKFSLQNELLRNLSQNNNITYQLDMNVDLLGDVVINISINGGPVTPYSAPCFCDALFAPVTTTNFQRLDNIAGDFDQMFDTITENDTTLANGNIMRTGIL